MDDFYGLIKVIFIIYFIIIYFILFQYTLIQTTDSKTSPKCEIPLFNPLFKNYNNILWNINNTFYILLKKIYEKFVLEIGNILFALCKEILKNSEIRK